MSQPERCGHRYQLAVEGVIGPRLRAALPSPHGATQVQCTLFVIEDHQGRQLDELFGLLDAADVTVQEIRRLG